MECEGAPASWIYGPMFTRPLARDVDQSRRARGSNFAEAVALIERIGFQSVFVYAMGQEPWLSHILDNELSDESVSLSESRRLMAYCAAHGITAEHPSRRRSSWSHRPHALSRRHEETRSPRRILTRKSSCPS
jgi:hypothetical protein